MAKFTFTNPLNGQKFTVSGPETLTETQAQGLFKQQLDTGALTGLKPGDAISSLKQAAAGVTGAIGSALSSVKGAIGSVTSKITDTISSVTGNIKNAINGALPANPLTTGDLAKSLPSLTSLPGLSSNDVTAGLASLSKTVGQASSVLSDTKGVGQFGFDVKQLETAGFVKPGTSNILNSAGATLSNVLKSPTVWTGKSGVTSVTDMLKNSPLQSLTQQNLMSKGIAGLGSLGVSVDKLNPQAAIGAALNSAKSLTDAAAWAKGLPLPSGIKSAMDTVAGAGAFGVNLSSLKTNDAMLKEIKVLGSSVTVNRATLNAAADRVVGDPKIPKQDYGGGDVTVETLTPLAEKVFENITNARAKMEALLSNVESYKASATTVTDAQVTLFKDELKAIRNEYNTSTAVTEFTLAHDKASASVKKEFEEVYSEMLKQIKEIIEIRNKVKALIAALDALVTA